MLADARSGAHFTLLATDEGDEILMTEGAVRSLIRAGCDALPGTLVGRIRFRDDLDAPELPLTIETDVLLAYGVPTGATVEALRVAITESPARYTRFVAPRVDVRVRDVKAVHGRVHAHHFAREPHIRRHRSAAGTAADIKWLSDLCDVLAHTHWGFHSRSSEPTIAGWRNAFTAWNANGARSAA